MIPHAILILKTNLLYEKFVTPMLFPLHNLLFRPCPNNGRIFARIGQGAKTDRPGQAILPSNAYAKLSMPVMSPTIAQWLILKIFSPGLRRSLTTNHPLFALVVPI
jgi:hypothetical protein